jgi:hypothetical protein
MATTVIPSCLEAQRAAPSLRDASTHPLLRPERFHPVKDLCIPVRFEEKLRFDRTGISADP